MSSRRISSHPQYPDEPRRSHYGSSLPTPRDLLGMRLVGEQKYMRYDTLGQSFAPGYAPATNVSPLGLRRPREGAAPERTDDPEEASTRGGNRGILPWPEDYRKRIHAVGRIVDTRWVGKMGFAKTWKPTLDQPKWVTLTQAGLRRLGLPYEEVDWPTDNTEQALEHYHHINVVRLLLARRSWEQIPKHVWICERELELLDTPRKLAGETLPTRPDGILEVIENDTMALVTGEVVPIAAGERIAIEVELSRKSFQRYGQIVFPSHLEHFAAVWYFCAPDAYNAVVAARRDRIESEEQRARIVIRKLELD
ncbi:hypothetical protein KDH_80060 [Dictyobacter sp. S3.2.2.5]|uniref:Uncharacterized protein n=1 Tax=Dictyobacter halimunensis TaxID=3026934 RepID=A0ABQ6G979_9CHLR|nr:hypothetical protein KDH_80060 [Dictyobacter sp. S3.2.2.5]